MPQKLETKTHSMTKKMLRLIAKIKSQVNQKQRKMQPMQPSAPQEMLKMLLTMHKIMLKN